ncbi:MAG TPA: M23 family metallopeptidase [Bacillota bacterium]
MSRRDRKKRGSKSAGTRRPRTRSLLWGFVVIALALVAAVGTVQAVRAARAREEAARAAAAAAAAALPSYTASITPSAAVDQGDFLAIRVKVRPGRTLTTVSLGVFGLKPAVFPVAAAGGGMGGGSGGAAVAPGAPVAYYSSVAIGSARDPGQYSVDLQIVDSRGVEAKESIPFTVRAKKFEVQRMTVTGQNAALVSNDKAWADDRDKVNAAKASPIPQALWDGPFIQPVKGEISTEFGQIRFVNGMETGRHSGVDLEAKLGQPVQATNAGVVVHAGPLIISGTTVIIDHGLNYYSSYNHLSKLLVAKGDRVAKGQEIGLVGSTGFSTAAHLHWTMTVGLTAVNPWLFVGGQPPGPLPEP